MARQIFRAVERWSGMATVRFEHRSQEVQLQLAVVAEIALEDDTETDTGQRFWSGRATGLAPSATGDVVVLLPGGLELTGRVAFDGTLSGSGVPDGLDRLASCGNVSGSPDGPDWIDVAPGA